MTSNSPRGSATPLGHWSAWVPIAIPLFLFALGVRYVALHGFVSQSDEGTEAHLFQLLMPVQLLVIAYFATSWMPRRPRGGSLVLALQLVLTVALLAAVWSVDHAGA